MIYLQSDHSFVNHDLLSHKISPDCSSVLLGKTLVHVSKGSLSLDYWEKRVLVHQGGFSDAGKKNVESNEGNGRSTLNLRG